MSKITDILAARNLVRDGPAVSFEYFPPRTDEGVAALYERLEKMAHQQPLFTDFTWGAGGSTSDLTLKLCVAAKERFGLNPNMHITW